MAILIFLCMGSVAASYAQVKASPKKEEPTTIPFKDRWAFKTNTVDWLLTLPNAAIEFDLSNSIYNKYTLTLQGRWNWQTSHTYVPPTVFNLWEGRAEVRKYWRTEYRANTGNDKYTLRERLFSRERFNPRYWRAYYAGIYVDAAGFSFKTGTEGIQGKAYGVGFSGGYSIPLYSYRDNYIDLELGGSVGFVMAEYDKYRADRDNNCYVPIAGKSKTLHFVPFPVVTDVRVAFIYRFSSIKDKYKRINHEKIQQRQKEKLERQMRKDSIRTSKHLNDSLEKMREQLEKDSLRQARQVADSLKLQQKLEKKAGKRKQPEALPAEKKEEEPPAGNAATAAATAPKQED